MRVDRTHIPWAIMVLFATAVAGLFFLANFHPKLLPIPFSIPSWMGEAPPLRRTYGGTPLGLIFGTLAFLIFLFASALGIRKKKRLWRIGNVQTWLKAHIWFTILTIPLVLFHCGFHAGGTHTTILLVLYSVVMVSGFFGLALQHFLPGIMKERLPREVVFEQIPHIQGLLFESALKLRQELRAAERAARAEPQPAVAAAGAAASATATATVAETVKEDAAIPVLGEFLDEECLPYLRMKRGERHRLGDRRASDDVFRVLRVNVTPKWQDRVDQIQRWCDDRRMMDLQLKLHHWLHGWLVIHVPSSFALLIFTAWHAWVAVRYLITLPA